MLSTVFLVAAGGLSSGQKLGLALVGAAFIGFSLVSALVLPRRYPNFPGRGVGWYSVLAFLFLVAMLAAVIEFGKERPEASEPAAQTSTASAPLPGQGSTTSTAPSGGAPQGNAQAGKAVFTSAGCSGCHTLKAAGATGTVGPNLDQLKPSFSLVQHQVIHGGGPMPAFGNTLTPAQIANVAAFVSSSTGGSQGSTGAATTGAQTTTTTSSAAGAPQGNAQAGKVVFTSAGCSGCHTLKAAGATGTVGPNLDQLKPSFSLVQHQVIHGGGAMPAFKGQLTPAQIANVAAFVSSSAGK